MSRTSLNETVEINGRLIQMRLPTKDQTGHVVYGKRMKSATVWGQAILHSNPDE